MKNIKALRQERHDRKAAADAIIATAEREGRRLTSKEEADFNELMGQLKMLAVEISATEAELDRERGQVAVAQSSDGADSAPSRPFGKIGAKYADLFGPPPPSAFKSADEFLRTIHAGLADPRLRADMNETVPAEGGFAVPAEYASALLDYSLEQEIVRPRAYTVPMTTETKRIVGFDAYDNSGDAPYGGLKLFWMSEGAPLNTEQSKLWLLQLVANKAALFSWVSNELIADGMSWDAAMGKSFGESTGWGLDVAFLTGSGAGRPLGILNDPALIVVPKETNQTSATVNYTNLTKMLAQIAPQCLDNSVWLMNNTLIPQITTMLYPGTAYPLFQQLQGPDGKFTILTRPVIFTGKVPALGTQGDVMLVDLSQYAIGMRKEVSVDRSGHVGFLQDQTGYRAVVRVGAQGRWKSSFQPRNGNPVSWCVALATRGS